MFSIVFLPLRSTEGTKSLDIHRHRSLHEPMSKCLRLLEYPLVTYSTCTTKYVNVPYTHPSIQHTYRVEWVYACNQGQSTAGAAWMALEVPAMLRAIYASQKRRCFALSPLGQFELHPPRMFRMIWQIKTIWFDDNKKINNIFSENCWFNPSIHASFDIVYQLLCSLCAFEPRVGTLNDIA